MTKSNHWLKEAFYDGLRRLDVKEIVAQAVDHLSEEGTWETGVISPSLVSAKCRLQRLKRFLGHQAQPGMEGMGIRQGVVDATTMINFTRGFFYEAVVVPALRAALGDAYIIGCAPTLVARWVYGSSDGFEMPAADDPLLRMWTDGQGNTTGLPFAGHPDLLIQEPRSGELANVQIKCPSFFKLERMQRFGDADVIDTYGAQMATEMYILRRMGYPVMRSYLFAGAWELTGKSPQPSVHVATMPWEPAMRQVPEEIAREIVLDADAARNTDMWPEAEKEAAWDAFPCSYCQYSRLGNFEIIGCTEQQEWERYARTGETRLTAGGDEEPPAAPPRRRRRS